MKKLIFGLCLATLAIAGGGSAVQAQPTNVSKTVLFSYNLDQTTTPRYCVLNQPINVSDRVTASASTTVTAVSGTPFATVNVGAYLHIVDSNGADYRRAVTIRNSSTSIVVSGANLTITSGKIQADSMNVSCGTTAAFGAFSVAGMNKFGVQVDVSQQNNTGGLQFHLQCRNSGSSEWVQRYPDLTLPTMTLSYTPAITATGRFILETQGVYTDCRIGSFIVTADDGVDTGVLAEQLTFTLLGRP